MLYVSVGVRRLDKFLSSLIYKMFGYCCFDGL